MAEMGKPDQAIDPKLLVQGLEDAERFVNRLMEAEKNGTLPQGEELEKRYRQALEEKRELQNAIDGKKQESAGIKKRITALKEECGALTDVAQKANRWVAMAEEIRPLGEEIIALEAAISALETQKMVMDQAIVMAEAYRELMNERLVVNGLEDLWKSKLEEIRQMKAELGGVS